MLGSNGAFLHPQGTYKVGRVLAVAWASELLELSYTVSLNGPGLITSLLLAPLALSSAVITYVVELAFEPVIWL